MFLSEPFPDAPDDQHLRVVARLGGARLLRADAGGKGRTVCRGAAEGNTSEGLWDRLAAMTNAAGFTLELRPALPEDRSARGWTNYRTRVVWVLPAARRRAGDLARMDRQDLETVGPAALAGRDLQVLHRPGAPPQPAATMRGRFSASYGFRPSASHAARQLLYDGCGTTVTNTAPPSRCGCSLTSTPGTSGRIMRAGPSAGSSAR